MYLICSSWLAAGFAQVFFLIFFLYVSIIQHVSILYIFILMCFAFHDIFFYGVDLFNYFCMYLLFKPLVFMVNLSFIYLNKNF